MHIDKIEKTKSGKYKLTLDNQVITTYDDVLLKNNLLYKKDIDDKVLEQIGKDTEYYDAYNKTINYIMRKIRSKEEIKKYQEKFDLKKEDNEHIIKHLEEIGLINDLNYAKAFISDKLYLSNDGPDKIREELLSELIPVEIIEDELAKIDSNVIEDKARKLITKKLKSNHKYSNYQVKQKIVIDLVNMGYNRELIWKILDNIEVEDDGILDDTYQKLYHKLSLKYSGIELVNKIKQKLYAKGFDINDINNYINKKMDL